MANLNMKAPVAVLDDIRCEIRTLWSSNKSVYISIVRDTIAEKELCRAESNDENEAIRLATEKAAKIKKYEPKDAEPLDAAMKRELQKMRDELRETKAIIDSLTGGKASSDNGVLKREEDDGEDLPEDMPEIETEDLSDSEDPESGEIDRKKAGRKRNK